jgi:hypothetical protein
MVEFKAPPVIKTDNEGLANICEFDQGVLLKVHPNPEIVRYIFSDAQGQILQEGSRNTYFATQTGTYKVRVISKWGCSSKSDFIVGNCCLPEIMFGNAIIPHSEAGAFLIEINNLDNGFFWATRNIGRLRFQIADRWGVVVFENNNEMESSVQAAECLRQGWNCQWKG